MERMGSGFAGGGGDGHPNGTRHRMGEFGDEPVPARRDSTPERLIQFDPNAPVSGHTVPTEVERRSASLAPEHDWTAAVDRIFPLLRPAGTVGLRAAEYNASAMAATANQSHAQPIVDEGPCGLAVVYAIAANGFDVIVNGDHLLTWGVGVDTIQDAALQNLASWSARAPWTEESSGGRHLLSSDTGDGWDATRILLPDARAHLAGELGASGRVLVGIPERHLLVAGALPVDDPEFGALLQDFVVEQSGGSDEPIDRRVFELIGDRLVEYAPQADVVS